MNDFTSLVKKLNEISEREDVTTTINESVEQPVAQTTSAAKSTANILRKFSEIEAEIVAEEAQAKEDVTADIGNRFREFMKSEVGQGNDLKSVNTAVREAHTTATILSGSIGVLSDSLKRQLEATKEGGVLQRMVEREGGDTKHIAKAYEALKLAAEALDAAHMYAVRMDQDVKEDIDFSNMPKAAPKPKPQVDNFASMPKAAPKPQAQVDDFASMPKTPQAQVDNFASMPKPVQQVDNFASMPKAPPATAAAAPAAAKPAATGSDRQIDLKKTGFRVQRQYPGDSTKYAPDKTVPLDIKYEYPGANTGGTPINKVLNKGKAAAKPTGADRQIDLNKGVDLNIQYQYPGDSKPSRPAKKVKWKPRIEYNYDLPGNQNN